MEHESPIKAWVRKHSPLKSRFATNKPLPPAPIEDSPAKRPIARPAAAAETVARGPSRFLSFLKRDPYPELQQIASVEESKTPKRKRGTFASLTSRDGAQRSPIRKSLRRQPSVDLNKLSKKVSSLEAQLKEARQELDSVVGTIRPDCSTNSEKINQAIEAKQQMLVDSDRYDGLVETLLNQGSPSYKQHSLNSSADLPRAYAEYLAIEDAMEADGSFVGITPRHTKRKRQADSDHEGQAEALGRSVGGRSHRQTHYLLSDIPQDAERPPPRRKSEHITELPPPPPLVGAVGSDSDHEPTTPTSRRPVQIKSSDLTRKRPHLPPPRLDSLSRTLKPSLRQPHKSAPPQHDPATSRSAVVYEESDQEYTSSGSSSPYTPPNMQKENIDPASSSPFHESPTPRSAITSPQEAASRTPAASPQPVALTPLKRHVRIPAKLSTVDEEFEWNDEEIF